MRNERIGVLGKIRAVMVFLLLSVYVGGVIFNSLPVKAEQNGGL